MGKILVFGGNGFIGSSLCRYFSEKKYEVYSFDLEPPIEGRENVHYIIGDFFEVDLSALLEDKDIVIHAVSSITPGNSALKYKLGFEKDFLQSVKLFDYISNHADKKLLFLSSGGTVYGKQYKSPITEKSEKHPINLYGTIKVCIEDALIGFNKNKNMYIVRISNPYGPGQDYKKGVGVIDALVKKTLRTENCVIYGDGSTVRDYIYIDDVCRYIDDVLLYFGDEFIFNIGTGVGTTQNEIIEILKDMGFCPQIEYVRVRNIDVHYNVLNCELINSFSLVKASSVREGMQSYINYLTQVEQTIRKGE